MSTQNKAISFHFKMLRLLQSDLGGSRTDYLTLTTFFTAVNKINLQKLTKCLKAYVVITPLKTYFMTTELLIYLKFWKFTEKVLTVRDANIVNITRVRSDLNEKNPIGLGNIKR